MFEVTESYRHPFRPRERMQMFSGERSFAFLSKDAGMLLVRTAWLGGARLCRVQSSGHRICLEEREHVTVLIPRLGDVEVDVEGRVYRARPGETLVMRPNTRSTRVLPGANGRYEADCLLVKVPRHDDHLTIPDSRGVPGPRSAHAFAGSLDGRSDRSLRSYAGFLIAEAEQPGCGLAEPRAARAAEALLVEMVATLLSTYLEDAGEVSPGRDSAARYVRAAEEIMAARLSEPISVQEVAATLGIGPRRLQLAFQALRGVTPRTMLSQMRLKAARDRLLKPHAGDSVSIIALDCGFAHFGRFAAAYAARYGEAPSATLRRA